MGVLSHFGCVWLCVSPMDYTLPGFSVHGILQTRVLEWVAMPFSRGSSQPRDQTCVSTSLALAGGFFTVSAAWEAHWSDIYEKQKRNEKNFKLWCRADKSSANTIGSSGTNNCLLKKSLIGQKWPSPSTLYMLRQGRKSMASAWMLQWIPKALFLYNVG